LTLKYDVTVRGYGWTSEVNSTSGARIHYSYLDRKELRSQAGSHPLDKMSVPENMKRI